MGGTTSSLWGWVGLCRLVTPSAHHPTPLPHAPRVTGESGDLWEEADGTAWLQVLCLECAGRVYCPGCVNTYQMQRGAALDPPARLPQLQISLQDSVGDHMCMACGLIKWVRDAGPPLQEVVPPRKYDFALRPSPLVLWPKYRRTRGNDLRSRRSRVGQDWGAWISGASVRYGATQA